MQAQLPLDEFTQFSGATALDTIATQSERGFDDLVALAAELCSTRLALISLNDGRNWSIAHEDFANGTVEDVSLLLQTLASKEILVVPDTDLDRRFERSVLLRGAPQIRFIAVCPLLSITGELLGHLCVGDSSPRQLAPKHETALWALAQQSVAIMELRSQITALQSSLIQATTSNRQLEQQQREAMQTMSSLRAQVNTDALTGLNNRRAFESRLKEELERTRRHKLPVSLALIDVDRFKSFNDTYGHPAGDDALRTLGRLLGDGTRFIDFVARYGGEEFAVIMPNTDTQGSGIVAQRLRAALAQANWPLRPITISIGTASQNGDCCDPLTLVEQADQALYAAKTQGRDRVVHAATLVAA